MRTLRNLDHYRYKGDAQADYDEAFSLWCIAEAESDSAEAAKWRAVCEKVGRYGEDKWRRFDNPPPQYDGYLTL